jgi:hypothetical protein
LKGSRPKAPGIGLSFHRLTIKRQGQVRIIICPSPNLNRSVTLEDHVVRKNFRKLDSGINVKDADEKVKGQSHQDFSVHTMVRIKVRMHGKSLFEHSEIDLNIIRIQRMHDSFGDERD